MSKMRQAMLLLKKIFTWILGRTADLIALSGLVVSLIALQVSYHSARSTDQIASQALQTSRQANEIALGTMREPAILQFPPSPAGGYEFDFTSVESINQELKQIVRFENDGKKNIEGATLELIGVVPLTYPLSYPTDEIRPLPSVVFTIDFNSAIQSGGSVSLDFRKPILQYLSKLEAQIQDKQETYTTAINVVITPKAVGEIAPVGAPTKLSPRDRELITVKFKSTVVTSDLAKKILEDPNTPNRVFSP